jgi:hypothetical protein
LYGDGESFVRYFNFNVEVIKECQMFNEIFHHSDNIMPEDKITVPLPITSPKTLSIDYSSKEIAESIIEDTIKPINGNDQKTIANLTAEIPPVLGGTLKINEKHLILKENEVDRFKVSKLNNVIHQVSNDTMATIKTMVTRYSKKYKVVSNEKDNKFVFSELTNGMMNALYGKPSSSRWDLRPFYYASRFREDMKTTMEELHKYSMDYMESLSEKCGDNIKTLTNECFDAMTAGDLNFFNKMQDKWKPEHGFDSSTKVGQGVAAYAKSINIIYSGYSRCILDKFRKILMENDRDIYLATHYSEAEINDHVLQFMKKHEPSKYSCNDFSEWDSSFRSPFTALTSYILENMGIPKHVVKWFETIRKQWKMTYLSSEGRVTLKGTEKQFSGNPFTICENTIGNMSLCFSLFEYINFKFAFFKGDDSAVACDQVNFKPYATRILNYTSHGLKLHNSPICEFAGWVLTKYGIFPDVLRYATKFLSKDFKDEDHFKEVLSSLQERCAAVKNDEQLQHGVHIVSEFYSQFHAISISPDQCRLLFRFLEKSREIKFDNLVKVKKSLKYF